MDTRSKLRGSRMAAAVGAAWLLLAAGAQAEAPKSTEKAPQHAVHKPAADKGAADAKKPAHAMHKAPKQAGSSAAPTPAK